MSKFGELIKTDSPVLIDFYTEWNEPSVAMHPVIRDVAAALGDRVKVIKIDVDKNPKVATNYNVQGVPTFILFENGKQKWRQSGMVTKQELLKIIHNLGA